MQTMQDKHDSTALAPVHLVVLQHGLWGNTTCVSNLEAFLREHLNPQSHSSTSTAAQGTSTDHAAAGDTDSKAKGTEESSTGPWFTAAAAGSAGTAKFADGATAQKAEVQILNSDVNRKALTYDGEAVAVQAACWQQQQQQLRSLHSKDNCHAAADPCSRPDFCHA
jgi:hypothetical protein